MNNLVTSNRAEITIPAFGTMPEIKLDITNVKEAECRLIESKTVNPITFSELSFVYNEGYREAKKNLSIIGYQIAMTDKEIRKIRAEYLLDEYQGFLKETKIKDSAAIREAFLDKKENYLTATDRLDMLKAMESLMESKIKVFENTCRFMNKQIEIDIRSGSIDKNKYLT
jgi:hypothetical protein